MRCVYVILYLVSVIICAISCTGCAVERNIEYYGGYIFLEDSNIDKRIIVDYLRKFEQCIKEKGYGRSLTTLKRYKVYLLKLPILKQKPGSKIVGMTVPSKGVIFVGSYDNYSSLTHELMHAIGLLTDEHHIADDKLKVCYQQHKK